jgi:hypothetical protein
MDSRLTISIDDDGYPEEASLCALAEWNGPLSEMPAVLDAVADYFNESGYGRARRRENLWRFATGGWSGCEEVLSALPPIFRAIAWRSSHRGGLHVYGLDRA